MPRGMCSLEAALDYECDAIVHKFRESWALPMAEARDLFTETKRFLWLAALLHHERAGGNASVPHLTISRSLVMLDEMWHTFILFTLEYTEYCQSRFGHYLHHSPTTFLEQQRLRHALLKSPIQTRRTAARRLDAQCRFVYDRLGEATLLKWYSDYADRYTESFVRAAKRYANHEPPASARHSAHVGS